MAQAGKFRHCVTVEHDTGSARDSLNQPVENWTTFKKVWAAIQPLEAQEAMRGPQIQAEIIYQVKTRWFPGLNESMRIRWGTRILYLAGPPRLADQGRNTVWEFACKEGKPDENTGNRRC